MVKLLLLLTVHLRHPIINTLRHDILLLLLLPALVEAGGDLESAASEHLAVHLLNGALRLIGVHELNEAVALVEAGIRVLYELYRRCAGVTLLEIE